MNMIPTQIPNKDIYNGKKCALYIDSNNSINIRAFRASKTGTELKFIFEKVWFDETIDDWDGKEISREEAIKEINGEYDSVMCPLTLKLVKF